MSILEQRKVARQGTTPAPIPPLSAVELAPLIGADDDLTRAGHLLEVAWSVVQEYAPHAPEPLRREAIIRFAGYLWGSDFGGVQSETLGPVTVEFVSNHGGAFRNSGAAMLLTRWRQRRAGAI